MLKVVLVGHNGLGKTSMVSRFTLDVFPLEFIPTVIDGASKSLDLGGVTINTVISETVVGEEVYVLRPLLDPGTDVCLVCFDVSDRSSFDDVAGVWVPQIQQHTPGVPMVLVGTKSDLRQASKLTALVSEDEATALAERVGCVGYMECSALTGENVSNVFEFAVSAGACREGPDQASNEPRASGFVLHCVDGFEKSCCFHSSECQDSIAHAW